MKESREFLLKFENIPLYNLRGDFQIFKTFVSELLIEGEEEKVLHSTKYHRDRFDLEADLNFRMRSSIMGLESYVRGAVAQSPKCKTPEEVRLAMNNPVSASGKGGICKAFYNFLPKLVDDSYALVNRNQALYERNLTFYREVRHPLFHGYEAVNIQPTALRRFCDHLDEMYQWIDSWYTLEPLRLGPS